jgi:putative transcriptional regulator
LSKGKTNHTINGRGESMKTRLKELRAREGMNQTQLAKLARISRQTVSLIEREEFIPSLLIAVRIARIFNEPIEQIFLFEEDE